MTRTAPSAWRVVRNVLLAVVALLLVAAATQLLWLAPLMSDVGVSRAGAMPAMKRLFVMLQDPVLVYLVVERHGLCAGQACTGKSRTWEASNPRTTKAGC